MATSQAAPRDIQFKQRLPLSRKVRYDQFVTIALGLPHTDGILLCSDSQMEGGAVKFQAPKIGMFEFPGGKIGFGVAGHVDFAISAIQKCADRLREVTKSETAPAILDETLTREYRRAVFEHPDYAADPNLAYSLLIAYWSKSRSQVSLFLTHEHIMHAC